jgi:hypothetical protein
MADYLLLFGGGSMPETDAEQAAVMEAWTTWFNDLGDAVKDQGNPFSGQAQNIASDGSVGGGTLAPTASGYTILSADSLDDALNMAKGCPVLQGGAQISVYETLAVM